MNAAGRRRASRVALPAVMAALVLAASASLATATVPGTTCPVFPADNVWNTDITSLPVNAQSAAWLANMGGPTRLLHPDFGSSGDPNAPYGIPFIAVDPSHPKVSVSFTYASESDPGPYPFGSDTPIEGGAASTGDRHALMIDKGTCKLYELYDAHYSPTGSTAGSGAIFDLTANGPLRPAGWTSADAAGLPIFPGLLRPDEVAAGVVTHAIRFTAQQTDRSYLWPARHQAGARADATLPPMGARFRLKASYDISGFHPAAQTVLKAMKKYGVILADNGSNWYFQGSASNSWDDQMISELKTVPAGQFDAIDESSLMIDPNSGQARQSTPPPPPPSPTPTATPPAPSPSPSPTATASPSPSPAPSASPSASPSPAPSPSATPKKRCKIICLPGVAAAATGGTPEAPVIAAWVLGVGLAGFALGGTYVWVRTRRRVGVAQAP